MESNALERARKVAEAALERKATDVLVLDVRGLTSFADSFVLASGSSDRQVRAIADAIVEATRAAGEKPLGIEGHDDGRWVLIDLNDVIVHVFLEEVREYYDLERLWGDAAVIEFGPTDPSPDQKNGPVTRPVVLVILDGFGLGDGGPHDSVAVAHTPFFDRVNRDHPTARIETSGEAVGLPPGQMGNSEVGHMTLGAGRIVEQDMTRISRLLADGVSENAVLERAFAAAERDGVTLHLMGLVSDGGVHSHQEHLWALLGECARRGIRPAVHAFLDGRDTPPRSGAGYLKELLPHVEAAGGHVATLSGRYWAMDRDTRWERIARAYDAIVLREGESAADALHAVEAAYERGESDEFVAPTVVEGGARLADGDAVIFFNFRADRARELTNALTAVCPDRFAGQLERRAAVKPGVFVCLTEYDADFELPVAFPAEMPEQVLGEILAQHELPQLRIAETEKYAHVTFFFNCGRETPFPGEDRLLIPSPRDVPTYDHKPEMSAAQVTETLLRQLAERDHAFVLVNYANPDMLGHTGMLPAAVKAVETVDACLERVTHAVLERGGELLITADHGNCELMRDPQTGEPHTAHTTNPVPLWWISREPRGRALRDGGLSDLAPTVLELLELPVPPEMTGRSLVR